jgi:hypothetical protein
MRTFSSFPTAWPVVRATRQTVLRGRVEIRLLSDLAHDHPPDGRVQRGSGNGHAVQRKLLCVARLLRGGGIQTASGARHLSGAPAKLC